MIDPKDKAIEGEGDLKNKAPEADAVDDKGEGKEGEGDKKDDIAPLLEGEDDEEITIKRGALKKIHSDKENYKTVALSKKGKGGEGKNLNADGTDSNKGGDEKFVTKAELAKEREDKAIETATIAPKDASEEEVALAKEINDNWDQIKTFYTGRSGKGTVEAIHGDILDAHAAWKRRYGSSEKSEKGGTAADLAASRGMGGTSPKPTQTGGPRKRIIPREQSAKDWFPKDE